MERTDAAEFHEERGDVKTDNRCVCCGEIIPEGRQICWICENNGEVKENEEGICFSERRKRNQRRLQSKD